MKQKKLIALLLSTALLLSGVNVQTSKAADEQKQQTVAVTLHMERDADTVLAPVTVTMTEDDKNNDFGIGLATGQAATYSPLRAFAKYLATKKKVTNDQMSKYIIASPSSNCKAGDKVDIYASYYHMTDPVTYAGIQSAYTAFSSDQYTTSFDKDSKGSVTLTLTEYGATYDANYNPIPYTKPVADAEVYIAKAPLITKTTSSNTEVTGATKQNAVKTLKTDANGKVTVTFNNKEFGEYYVSAAKWTEDGKHNLLVRPFTTIAVHQIKGGPAVVKVTKPAQVKSLKAKVVKSKKAKKSVKLTWKKASRAKGYQVYVSKKNKKHFKKSATVKKTKKTLKLKKGTYYVKVRAYNKVGKQVKTGKFSKIVKVKVK